MESTHFVELQDKGYTIVRNHLNQNEISEWKDLWPKIEKESLLSAKGIKKIKEPIYSDIFDDEGKPYVWKTQNSILRLDKGIETIEKYEKILQRNINKNVRFVKDRFMNQKTNYLGHLPHQDLATGCHRNISDKWYTLYISLTDTDVNSGCLWVEDITPKRTSRLGYCDEGCVNGKECLCTSIKVMPVDIKEYKGHNLIPIDLKAGDLIVFDGWLLHGTACNLSNDTRQTLMFTYAQLREEDLDRDNVFDYYNKKFSEKKFN